MSFCFQMTFSHTHSLGLYSLPSFLKFIFDTGGILKYITKQQLIIFLSGSHVLSVFIVSKILAIRLLSYRNLNYNNFFAIEGFSIVVFNVSQNF
jgi:hypothetical protein